MNVRINPRDIEEIKQMMKKLSGAELVKAQVRGINKTADGVKTDGVKMLTGYYALKASDIRASWKIRKAAFKSPTAAVSSKGTFIRLIKYGAKQTNEGVSVRVLKSSGRKIVKHAYIGKVRSDQKSEQVYRRKYHDENRAGKTSRINKMAGKVGWIWSAKQNRYFPAKWMPEEYRRPVKALYGPRIQDYLSDPAQISVLQKLAGERLVKSMKHEVEYLLSLAGKQNG
jgi:hypothetical protein